MTQFPGIAKPGYRTRNASVVKIHPISRRKLKNLTRLDRIAIAAVLTAKLIPCDPLGKDNIMATHAAHPHGSVPLVWLTKDFSLR